MTSAPHVGPCTTGPDPLDEGGLSVVLSRPFPDVAVVRTVGEIDLATAPEWAEVLGEAYAVLAAHGAAVGAEQGTPRLVCD